MQMRPHVFLMGLSFDPHNVLMSMPRVTDAHETPSAIGSSASQ